MKKIRIPSYKKLETGNCLDVRNRIVSGVVYPKEDLIDIYLSGNWYVTFEEAQEEVKLRKIKFALNQLRIKCNKKYPLGVSGIYLYFRINRMNELVITSLFDKYLFYFTSVKSIEMFKKQCKSKMFAEFKKMIEKGKL